MKTILLVVLVTAAVAAAAVALPPLGSVAAQVGLGNGQDTAVEEYSDLDYQYDDTNGTDYTDDTNSTDVTDTDYTDDTNSTDTDYTDDTDETDDSTPVDTTTTSSTTTPKPADEPLSGGAIAGIVIGSVAGVALIAGGIYYMKVKEMACFG